jgi:hypothetical protein
LAQASAPLTYHFLHDGRTWLVRLKDHCDALCCGDADKEVLS